MHDWDWRTGGELGDAADVAGRDQVGLGGCYVGQLAIPRSGSNLRLQDVVGPRRAAAEMPFRHLWRLEARAPVPFGATRQKGDPHPLRVFRKDLRPICRKAAGIDAGVRPTRGARPGTNRVSIMETTVFRPRGNRHKAESLRYLEYISNTSWRPCK